jgi:hypothetical protein
MMATANLEAASQMRRIEDELARRGWGQPWAFLLRWSYVERGHVVWEALPGAWARQSIGSLQPSFIWRRSPSAWFGRFSPL